MKQFSSALLLFMLMLAPAPANADTVVFLDVCAADSAPCQPGLANLGIVRFAILDDGSIRTQVSSRAFGDNAFGFNLAGSTQGFAITIDSPQFTFGGNHETIGPFGSFDYVFDGPPFVAGVAPFELRFTMRRDAGFLSPLDVFAMNDLGYLAAAHNKYLESGTFFNAGTDVDIIGEPVPEPGSLVLVGTGLLAAYRARRQRRIDRG